MSMSKFLIKSNSCRIFFFFTRLADIIHRRSYDFMSRYDFLFKFTKTYKRQQELIQALHYFTDSVIKARRNELLTNGEVTDEKKKKALLDLLLTTTIDGKALTNTDIREEIDTFMFEVGSFIKLHYNYSNKFFFSLPGSRYNS